MHVEGITITVFMASLADSSIDFVVEVLFSSDIHHVDAK